MFDSNLNLPHVSEIQFNNTCTVLRDSFNAVPLTAVSGISRTPLPRPKGFLVAGVALALLALVVVSLGKPIAVGVGLLLAVASGLSVRRYRRSPTPAVLTVRETSGHCRSYRGTAEEVDLAYTTTSNLLAR